MISAARSTSTFASEGFRARSADPGASMWSGKQAGRRQGGHPRVSRRRASRRSPTARRWPACSVLLVEDSLIIALDAEDMIRPPWRGSIVRTASIGAGRDRGDRIEPARHRDARHQPRRPHQLPRRRPAGGAGHPVPVRHRLWRAGQLPPELKKYLVVQKPYTLASLARGLGQLIDARVEEGANA